MTELLLFEDMQVEIKEPETMPEQEITPIKRVFKRRIIGDNFIVVKCLSCTQLIMVDPEYYELDEYRDKICEDCNTQYHDKYAKFLKLKL